MNIVFITPEFKTEDIHDGGLASYLDKISNELIKNHHKVSVIVYSKKQPQKHLLNNGVKVYRTKQHLLFKVINIISRGVFYGTIRRLDFAYGVYHCLRKLARSNQIDIVQYPNYYASGLISIPLLNLPCVIRISSDRKSWSKFSIGTLDTYFSDVLETLQFRACKHLFSPTEKLKNIIDERIPNRSIKIIPTPMFCNDTREDSSFFEKNLADKDYILYFGRLETRKGVKLLIDSLSVFFTQTNGHVVLIGRDLGTERVSSFRSYADEKYPKFKDRLLFCKPLNHSKLFPVIRNSQFVVIPSLIDNMPNTLLESLYFGKPAIVLANSGNEEIIKNRYNGFVVKKNINDLARAIVTLYRDKTKLLSMSKNAKKSSETYSINSIYEKTFLYYRSIIK